MSDMPKSVQVGPFLYRIIVDTASFDRHRMANDDSQWTVGKASETEQAIYLDDSMPECLLRATMLHEVLHAVQFTAGIRVDGKVTAEDFITRCTPLLLDTLRRNPDLVAFLMEGEHS